MRTSLNIVGILLLLVGTIWMGQGANLIAGSFMTGERRWLAIGGLCAVAGLVIVFWANSRYRRD